MLFPSLEERTSAAVDLPRHSLPRLSFSVIPCPLSDHPHLSPQHPHSPSTHTHTQTPTDTHTHTHTRRHSTTQPHTHNTNIQFAQWLGQLISSWVIILFYLLARKQKSSLS